MFSFTRQHFLCGFCLGTVLRQPWKSSFISRICDCCNSGGAVRATSPGPKRSSFTGTLREFRCCRGSLLCNSMRPSFTSSHCVCCSGGAVRAIDSGPKRSSFTWSLCEFTFHPWHSACQEGPASPENTAITDSVVTQCSAFPGSRASPTAFATVASSGRVVSSAPGQEDPVSPEDPSNSGSVAVLYCGIMPLFLDTLPTWNQSESIQTGW